MRTFKEFLEESVKLSKTESDFLRQFTKKGEIIKVQQTADNSNIRGGTSSSGVRDMKTAKSLVDKGILKIVDGVKDSGAKTVSFQLIGDPDITLNQFELDIYKKIKAFNNGEGYSDRRDPSSFMKTNKKEQDAMKRLSDLGLIKFSTLSPKVLKDL